MAEVALLDDTEPISPERAPSLLEPGHEGIGHEEVDRRAVNWSRVAAVTAAGYLVLMLVMLAIGYTLTHVVDGSVGRWDEHGNVWFANHRTVTWNNITGIATLFVNTTPAIGLAAIIAATLAWRRRWHEAAMLVVALVLELLVFLSVSWLIARPRPMVVRLNETPSTSSFPSGHTAAATVLFVGLAVIITCCTRNTVVRAAFFVLAIAAATTIGFARVYRGMHHPTDVFAGALLGVGCVATAVLAVRASADPGVRRTGEMVPRAVPPNAARSSVGATGPS